MTPASELLPELVRATVIVHTKDGQSLAGVLTGAYLDVLVLDAPSYLTETGRTPLEGRAIIPRLNVAFVQTDPGAAG